jgi:UPF0755 protein
VSELPEQKKEQSKSTRVFLRMALVLLLGGTVTAAWFCFYLFTPGPDIDTSMVIVEIPKGNSSRQIAALLAEKQLIHEDIRFLVLVRLMGKSARLQAGEFKLHTGQRPKDLIEELSRAKPVSHVVTIPEGMRITQIARIFADGGWGNADRFIAAASDQRLIEQYNTGPAESLEGYLFPDTYHLVKSGGSEADLVEMMVKRAIQVWDEASVGKQSSLDRHQAFTLASIIEKESANDTERPIIAGVFFNRLKKKMRLQSDPTVIYGIKDFDGDLKRSHLRTPTPYNTYTNYGLPPGPICSPGRKSIEAALNPAPVEYLYFVSKNNGTHHFSKTLREHNKAVRKYQKQRKKKQG